MFFCLLLINGWSVVIIGKLTNASITDASHMLCHHTPYYIPVLIFVLSLLFCHLTYPIHLHLNLKIWNFKERFPSTVINDTQKHTSYSKRQPGLTCLRGYSVTISFRSLSSSSSLSPCEFLGNFLTT